MRTIAFTGHELAYLLGAVGTTLQQAMLDPRDRNALLALRDRLAPLVSFDDEVAESLGLTTPETQQ